MTPTRRHEDLLDVLTFRRADGKEISLREFPISQLLSIGETLRAEEIVLRAPDGRSVTVLLNATPTLSDEGAVESVVVTMQDMAEVREMERLRTEFLAMVSHELRQPLTSIKGAATTVLGSPADPDPAVMHQFFRIIEDRTDRMNSLIDDLVDMAHIEAGTLPVNPEAAEVAVLVDRARGVFISAAGKDNLAIDIRIGMDLPSVLADHRRIIPGVDHPADQRGAQLPGVVGHQGDRRSGGHSRRDNGGRRGKGHPHGKSDTPVQEILSSTVQRPEGGHQPWPCDLQGDSGGARRAHLGREWRTGTGSPLYLHAPEARDIGDQCTSTALSALLTA